MLCDLMCSFYGKICVVFANKMKKMKLGNNAVTAQTRDVVDESVMNGETLMLLMSLISVGLNVLNLELTTVGDLSMYNDDKIRNSWPKTRSTCWSIMSIIHAPKTLPLQYWYSYLYVPILVPVPGNPCQDFFATSTRLK